MSDIPNVDEHGASYIDVNMVKVIGFEPPMYMIKAMVYKEFYDIADAVYYEIYKQHFDEVLVK
ncbi:hypothetical protein [uncultured Veillonella sp.]|uniref:hypothetical protein n=1 Tax=uncultured Veillonella sp. TaxID=159268 RepID=UPI0028DBED23|nr:hypothetical protein [uncultured Veillonella sp.]